MKLKALKQEGLLLVEPPRIEDGRGSFCVTYLKSAFADAGFDVPFVQDNLVHTIEPHVLRGLHYQSPPCAQDKLIQVLNGAILDVVVDIRRNSPTYGQHTAIELSAENGRQLLAPVGFAHGYLTLTPHCLVAYKVSAYYAPETEGGLSWSDPALDIAWGVPFSEIVTTDRDQNWPSLHRLESPFQRA